MDRQMNLFDFLDDPEITAKDLSEDATCRTDNPPWWGPEGDEAPYNGETGWEEPETGEDIGRKMAASEQEMTAETNGSEQKATGGEPPWKKELLALPPEKLRERATDYLNTQYRLWENSNNRMVFGTVKIVTPYLLERTGSDPGFCLCLLSPGKDFAGMYMHLYGHFRKKAEEEYEKLTEEEKKMLGPNGRNLCYSSGDDSELFAPACEYFEKEANNPGTEKKEPKAGKGKKPDRKKQEKKDNREKKTKILNIIKSE